MNNDLGMWTEVYFRALLERLYGGSEEKYENRQSGQLTSRMISGTCQECYSLNHIILCDFYYLYITHKPAMNCIRTLSVGKYTYSCEFAVVPWFIAQSAERLDYGLRSLIIVV